MLIYDCSLEFCLQLVILFRHLVNYDLAVVILTRNLSNFVPFLVCQFGDCVLCCLICFTENNNSA